ncbi:MAG: LysM peptidoglycan-binding domain-containing protein [Gammaproteobacteria bacterium]|nr:LysM peptidoglycan-binding domain-containing protein [Gammaproteobacteria bacterium]
MDMKRIFGVLLALHMAAATAADQPVAVNPNHPDSYVVVPGDTLWDISGRFLAHPWQWPDIWEVNPQIKDPHWIYPGDVITLSYRNGRPVLGLSRGRDVKLSPSIRSYGREQAIPPIPLDAIRQFLTQPLVVTEDELRAAPYVVAHEEERLIAGAANRTYIRGLAAPQSNRYSLYRQGIAYRDPDHGNEVIGFEALHVGDISLESFGDPAVAVIIRSSREVLAGDRLLPHEAEEFLEFVPRPPQGPVDGAIIAVVDGVTQIGQYHVVVLNLGMRDNVGPGTVLAIYQSGRVVRDLVGNQIAQASSDGSKAIDVTAGTVQLPEERAGELMVFRSFDRVSFALVMNTQRAVHVLDRVRNP